LLLILSRNLGMREFAIPNHCRTDPYTVLIPT
jgi:hypothetical protein